MPKPYMSDKDPWWGHSGVVTVDVKHILSRSSISMVDFEQVNANYKLFKCHCCWLWAVLGGVFKTLSSIYNGAFLQK